MASIDDEWENFMLGKPDKRNRDDENEGDYEDNDNDEVIIPDIPQCRDLYISTKTKKPKPVEPIELVEPLLRSSRTPVPNKRYV